MKTIIAAILLSLTLPSTVYCDGCFGVCSSSAECGALCVCAGNVYGPGRCVSGR